MCMLGYRTLCSTSLVLLLPVLPNLLTVSFLPCQLNFPQTLSGSALRDVKCWNCLKCLDAPERAENLDPLGDLCVT